MTMARRMQRSWSTHSSTVSTPTLTSQSTVTASQSQHDAPVLYLQASDPRQTQSHFQQASDTLLQLLTDTQQLIHSLRHHIPSHGLLVYSANDVAPEEDAHLPDAGHPLTRSTSASVLNLSDIRLGPVPLSVDHLESIPTATLISLLLSQLDRSLSHLDKLKMRVEDSRCKVLVTGDVNAGKSTLINALLRRDVCPVDQQPYTTSFCEIIGVSDDTMQESGHLIQDVHHYDPKNPQTFQSISLQQLEHVVANPSALDATPSLVKVYLTDPGQHSSDDGTLLHNGMVDVTLIDGPGLNTDTVHTLAMFARQEEIDVVVFVVNAENHFTLSGREFIKTATEEKSHIFFAIHRFDCIRDNNRCRNAILAQVKDVAPETYAEATDLVHFISAQEVVESSYKVIPPDFARMERCLRWFTLEKRARAKLGPAKRYLNNVLQDILNLARQNRDAAAAKCRKAEDKMDAVAPVYDALVKAQRIDIRLAEDIMDDLVDEIRRVVRKRLMQCVDDIEYHPKVLSLGESAPEPEWNLIARIMTIRNAMMSVWSQELRASESWTVQRVTSASEQIAQLGQGILSEPAKPASTSRMFSQSTDATTMKKKKKKAKWTLNVGPKDLINIRENVTALSLSIGGALGGMMVFGSAMPMLGLRSLVWDAFNFGRVLGGTRRTIAVIAAVGLFTVSAFVIGDVRHALYRRIASKMRQDVIWSGVMDEEVDRIQRRATAVLRYSLMDLQRRYQGSVEREKNRKRQVEEERTQAKEARKWYKELGRQAKDLKTQVHSIEVDGLSWR